MTLTLWLEAFAPVAALMGVLWLLSIVLGRVSFIDAAWAPGFALLGWSGWLAAGRPTALAIWLALGLVSLWALRLGGHLLRRHLTEGEDRRYTLILKNRQGLSRHLYTLTVIFALQALLIGLIGLPLLSVVAAPDPATPLVAGGALLALTGIALEALADHQLTSFKADSDNQGRVLDSGLWAWTRHPNYFGDACLWWGLWLIGHDPVALAAPVIMTVLLMKWSGVPMLEKGLRKRRPGYEDYMARVPAFFPRPPRRP
ncbi:DUF1295 domain-containing protein [Yunchengibacter salinarum]|uniref:DUF1295 domain-containing protein n=1 Tax=Yunchengibacter salinarum TaxID=3133399 RepID=UPI0035B68E34